jgi:predicted anti-sigma-YlaC factor YlaD
MSNPCPGFDERLALAAELDEQTLDPSLAAHLAACPDCRAALAAQRGVRAMLLARPPLTASPALRVRVREAIEREQSWTSVIDFRRWTWRLFPVAAAIALATAFGAWQLTPDANGTAAPLGDLTASAALYTSDVPDSSVLSLMLRAQPDAQLASYLESSPR